MRPLGRCQTADDDLLNAANSSPLEREARWGGWFALVCIGLLFFVLGLTGYAHAAEVVDGILTSVAGDVEVQKRGGQDWIRAYDEMKIGPGDQISTGIDGRAILAIKGSKTKVSPLTQFVVGRSVESSDQVYTELFLRMGQVVSRVPKKTGESNIRRRFNVITPTAVVGVRGTEQTVGYFPGTGTDAKIRDGKGFAAPTPDALAAPARAVLGISPARTLSGEGEDNGNEKKAKDDKDKKKKKKEKGTLSDEGEETDKQKSKRANDEGGAAEEGREATPEAQAAEAGGQMPEATGFTPEAAVDQFNQWLDKFDLSVSPDAGVRDLGLLDDKTLEFIVPVDNGLRVTVGDRENPEAFVNTVSTQQVDAQTDIAPQGLSPAEQQESTTSLETVDQPVSISVTEDQSTFQQATEAVTQTSTLQGGIPPTVPLVIPPALPDVTGKININN